MRNYLPSNYTNRFWIAGVLSCRPIFLEKQFSNWCCFSYHFFFCIFQCQDLLLCTYVKTVSNSFSKETHLATNQHPFAWMQFSNHITTRNYHLSFRIDTYSAFQRSLWFTPQIQTCIFQQLLFEIDQSFSYSLECGGWLQLMILLFAGQFNFSNHEKNQIHYQFISAFTFQEYNDCRIYVLSSWVELNVYNYT